MTAQSGRESALGQSWLWVHFCFRPLWEDEMFTRQLFSPLVARARDTFTAATLVATLRKTRDVKFFLVTRRLCVLPGLPFWTD